MVLAFQFRRVHLSIRAGGRGVFRRAWWIAVLLPVFAGGAAAGTPGEFSLFAGYWAGDYGTGVETNTQAMTFRYVYGNRFRLRTELPVVRVQPSDVTHEPGTGPLQLRGIGYGSQQGQGGNGTGTGPGGGGYDSLGNPSGLGDLRVAGSFDVVGGGVKLFRMETNVEVKIPTADEEQGLGTGEWDLRVGLAGEYRFWPVTAYGGVGWTRFGDPEWVELNDVVDAYAGVEGDAFRGRIIVSGWIDACPEVVEYRGPETIAGLEFRSLGRYRWRVGFTAGLGGYDEYGVVLGYSFQTGAASRGYRGMLR
jgi:hypothetical protein